MSHSDLLGRLLPAALALVMSLVSLRMAAKGLTAREWLPFHQAAAAAEWNSLTPRLRQLLLFMVRTTALGFFALFLLLATAPAYLLWNPSPVAGLEILGVGAIYCLALGILTRSLHRETGARTPWRASFGAAAVLILAAALSIAMS